MIVRNVFVFVYDWCKEYIILLYCRKRHVLISKTIFLFDGNSKVKPVLTEPWINQNTSCINQTLNTIPMLYKLTTCLFPIQKLFLKKFGLDRFHYNLTEFPPLPYCCCWFQLPLPPPPPLCWLPPQLPPPLCWLLPQLLPPWLYPPW